MDDTSRVQFRIHEPFEVVANQQFVKEIREHCEKISQITDDDWILSRFGSPMRGMLSNIVPRIRNAVNALKILPIEYLVDRHVEHIRNLVISVWSIYEGSILRHDPIDRNQSEAIGKVPDELRDIAGKLEMAVKDHGSYLLMLWWNSTDRIACIDELLSGLNHIQDETLKTNEESQRILRNIESGPFRLMFKERAETHKKASQNWLITLLGSIACLIGLGIWFYFDPHDLIIPEGQNAGWYIVANSLFPKLLLLSGLIYLIKISAQNYRSQIHNQLVNTSRQKALDTFEGILKETEDQDTKNAILLQAVKTIFGHIPTGYESGDPDIESGNTVFEVVNRLDKGKSG